MRFGKAACRYMADMQDSETAMPNGGKKGHLRVMTFNLLSPEHGDWERRRPVIQAGIAKWRPDLIALQEAARGADYEHVSELLGAAYHVVHHSHRSDDGVGAAFASRWPVR